jgi:hypothetical protein
MDPPDSEKGGSAERQALEWCTIGYGTQKVQRFPRNLMVVAGSKLGMALALPPLKHPVKGRASGPECLYSVTVLIGLHLSVGGRCLAASSHRGA